jgi:hypothetical protein
MSSNVAKISELIVSFNNAVRNPENLDEHGFVNWNFVDADIHMDAGEVDQVVPEDWYSVFNDLADEYELNQLQESV